MTQLEWLAFLDGLSDTERRIAEGIIAYLGATMMANVNELHARIDALEKQLALHIGQVEHDTQAETEVNGS